ncbi:MAG TPA: type I-E CRISPR-associated endonuclease Cas1 [Candidatus Hydrogenedentes bacterium]|nr:type I-E CRISPR-associated endonuclease Cas1 [Candidatus Hydrogenedentota bacterium]
MLTRDLHEIPKVRDKLSYLYVEHCRVDREAKAIAVHDQTGLTPVPCASLTLLMLGPGTNITHAAIQTLADCGCLVIWCGEHAVRFYASGTGTTRSASNLLRQATLCTHKRTRLLVIRRMYEMRFGEFLDPGLTLQQIRGREGVRVRDTYARASLESGVPWQGRTYKRDDWHKADPINRALSVANACLYGLCHAAIVAAGFSPALGFIHTGKQLSFVYDVADLYKTDITIPTAFRVVAEEPRNLDRQVRLQLRDAFAQHDLLRRVVAEIQYVLDIPPPEAETDQDFDADPALPGGLWNPNGSVAEGGVQYGNETEEDEP